MTDVQQVDCNFLLRPEFEKLMAAAKKNGRVGGQNPLAYLNSLMADPRYITQMAELQTLGNQTGGAVVAWLGGAVAGTLVGTMLGGPIGLIGFIGMLIDGNRSARIIVVNDTQSDLVIDDTHLERGERFAEPRFGKQQGYIPRRLDAVPDPSDSSKNLIDASVWYGCLGYQKATTLGIGFYGTSGGVHFRARSSHVAPKGLSIGWLDPENGKNNCAVSVNRGAKDLFDKFIDVGTRRSTDGSTNSASGVKVYCAMESLNDNPNDMHLLVVLTDSTSW
ncbi:MAG: hypothetical protein AAF515_07150 [Pseudomonadota bacterium]